MNIEKIIDSLNLIYYDFDKGKSILIKDVNYSNKHTQLEFFKLTYYLAKEKILFDVLQNKSIIILEKKDKLKGYLSMVLENIKKFNKNIFILNDKNVKWAKNIPLFKIVFYKQFISLKNYDALIFTSKNAINAIDRINKEWKKIPSYVISEQTAKLVKDYDGNLEYISNLTFAPKTKQFSSHIS